MDDSMLVQEVRTLFQGGRADLREFDASTLLPLLEREGVALLADRLIEHTGSPCRQEVIQKLRDIRVQATALEAFRVPEVRRICDSFGQKEIPILLLKGTPLAHSLYPAPELRPRSDTDVLVEESRLPEARDLFSRLGYVAGASAELSHVSTQFSVSRTDRQVTHEIDVHWKLSNAPAFAGLFTWRELWSRARAVAGISPVAKTLSNVDALIYACMHRVAHHYASTRLIWLYDVKLLSESLTDPEVVTMKERCREKGLTAICRDTIEQTAHWFAADPDAFISRYAPAEEPEESSAAFLIPAATRGEQLRRDLRAIGSWRGRAQYLLEMAFPPPRFMKRRYGVKSGLLLPMLYVRRAVAGCASLLRRTNR